ncbi:MAG: hypothetical protein RJQ09_07695 [Cyclobacteriaceae bacterium]
MRPHKQLIFWPIILLGCATFKPHFEKSVWDSNPQNSELLHTTIIVSNTGSHKDIAPSIWSLANREIDNAGENSTLIINGGVGPKFGMPDSSHLAKRTFFNEKLQQSLEVLANSNGKKIVVPGYYEWGNGRKDGIQRINRLEKNLNNQLSDQVVFPADGCAGPIEIDLNDQTVLLAINTQWWFQEETTDERSVCEITGKADFLGALGDAIDRNYQKQIFVVGYHPLYTNGPSAGFYPWPKHVAPPVFGTLHAFYKRFIGDPDDASNLSYRIFRALVSRIFEKHENLVYLGAGERSLQYFQKKGFHNVVTGSLDQPTAVRGGRDSEFTFGSSGFTKINQYTNGDTWLEFWTIKDGAEEVYRKKLYNWQPPEVPDDPKSIDYSGQTVTAYATKQLDRNKKRPGLLGKNYRAEWSVEIDSIPVFDLARERGGLEIVKKGGGQQTRSLRLEAENGRQYVLRSIRKYPENAIAPELRGTYIDDFVSDQVSASHPYGAFVIPPMAKAVGVYYSNPEIVYLPDDPRLGIYQNDFKEGLYLYEERADDDFWADAENFGNAEEIESTSTVIEKMVDSGDDYPDQAQTIKSRLFDIVIGDWDRHDDQWRWAKFEDAEKYGEGIDSYEPIPRDRDQAFFLGDGALLEFGSHKWGQPKFQGFHHKIRDVEGLAFNARYFDRYFITEAGWSIWEEQAEHIQKNLTDEVIEKAIKTWPEEIYALSGEEIVSKLKQRRDDLHKYARSLYLFLAKDVNVLGTDQEDLFKVERLNDSETKVSVFRVKNQTREVKSKYYERTFLTDETREIRLFGFGDEDEFQLEGSVNKGPKIRMIGGDGEDKIVDNSRVAGLSNMNVFYDRQSGTTIQKSGETKIKVSDRNAEINEYDRRAFQYDILAPQIFGGFNPDDAILIGGGFAFTKHGFRKDPFSAKHTFVFDASLKSQSYNFHLTNEFNQAFGKWDFVSRIDVSEPSFADFFYGFGNGTVVNDDAREDDSQYYRARYSMINVSPTIRRRWNDDKHSFELGGFYQRINVEEEDNDFEGDDRFIFQYADFREGEGFQLIDDARHFIGSRFSYSFDNTNDPVVPTSGLKFNFTNKLVSQLADEDSLNSSQVNSNLSFYLTIGKSERVTLASRFGGIATFGEFEFYHAARMGGLNNFRGHRRLRFAGNNVVYQNNDIRIKLFDFRSKLFVGPVGINLIADFGRVWATDLPGNVESDEWHKSVGGGFWLSPFKVFVLAFDYTKSLSIPDEDGVPFIRFGFLF